VQANPQLRETLAVPTSESIDFDRYEQMNMFCPQQEIQNVSIDQFLILE